MEKEHINFWSKVEQDLSTNVPNYIKNGFHLRGFRDAITFQKVGETQINAVEIFIRTQLPQILLNWKSRDGTEINDECFFGDIHVFDPSGFEFTEGDRIQIEAIAAHVKSVMEDSNRGPKYFAANTLKSVKPNYKQVGQYFGASAVCVIPNQNTSVDKRMELFIKARAVLKKKGVSNNQLKQFTEEMVVVTEHGNSNPTGTIECVLCENLDGARESQCVQSKVEGDPPKIYWILSNFSKHIERHNKKLKLDESKLVALDSPSIDSFQTESHDSSFDANITPNQIIATHEEIVIDEFDQTNDSVIFLQIEPLNQSFTIESVQSLIYDQISEQMNDMLEASLKHNTKENDMAFEIDNKEFTLQFAQIDADGNCLFAALEHQLSKTKIGSRVHINGATKLRKDVVKYIKNHRSEFEHELKGKIYERYEGKHVENIENACNEYLEKELTQKGVWGGMETLKAVTRMKFVNILVMNAKGEGYFPCCFNMKLKKTVVLTFDDAYSESIAVEQSQNNECDASNGIISNSDRNHYNSVVRMDQSDIYALSEMLATLAHKRIMQQQIDTAELLKSAEN